MYRPQAVEPSTKEEHIPTTHSGRCSSEACKSPSIFCMWPAKWILALQVRPKEFSVMATLYSPHGRFRWTRLLFREAPALEIFQRKLAEQLEGVTGITMIAEDILVFGQQETEEEAVKNHDKNLEELLQRAEGRETNQDQRRKIQVPAVWSLLYRTHTW